MAWFERAALYLDQNAVEFTYSMSGRHGAQLPWTYQMHLATQIPALRAAMRTFYSGQRWYLARRRGEPTTSSVLASRRVGKNSRTARRFSLRTPTSTNAISQSRGNNSRS
jgi:hypothetical protein